MVTLPAAISPGRIEYMRSKPSAYGSRDLLLADAGYTSYREYLLSDRWYNLRACVLDTEYYCELCDSRASQVHHIVYNHHTLFGELGHPGLSALCRRCHKWLEFSGRKKGSLEDAAHKMCWKLYRLGEPARAREVLRIAGLPHRVKRYTCPMGDILNPHISLLRKSRARAPMKRAKSKKG